MTRQAGGRGDGQAGRAFHWPSETTWMSAVAMVLSGICSWSRCGKIEKSTTPSVRSSGAEGHEMKSSPIRGVITMLPALIPTQTVSGSDSTTRDRPDSRTQWQARASDDPTARWG